MISKALATLSAATLLTAPALGAGFDVTAIGVRGGLDDGNLSAWMIAPAGETKADMCDAGSLVNGIETARRLGTLKGSLDTILHNDIAVRDHLGALHGDESRAAQNDGAARLVLLDANLDVVALRLIDRRRLLRRIGTRGRVRTWATRSGGGTGGRIAHE